MPTIYELTKITPPKVVNGFEQDSIDGVSMAYAFGDAKAPGTRKTQFFDIMASRGIYHDGWFASAPGPREPWVGGMPKGVKEWSPLTDKWELYNIDEDWSQANDLAAANPKKLEEMKLLFLLESTKNKNLPIGGGLWSTAMFHPEDAPASTLTEWTFDAPITRMPESAAPKLGKVDSLVTMDVDVPANANGVLYALAGFSGGVTCYVKDGFLCYEFNLFEVQRTKLKSKDKLPTGKVKVEVESKLAAKIGGPMDVTLKVNGKDVAQGRVPAAMSLHFTSQCDLRHRHRPGFARLARLLRPGAVRLQRHHRHDDDQVSEEVGTRTMKTKLITRSLASCAASPSRPSPPRPTTAPCCRSRPRLPPARRGRRLQESVHKRRVEPDRLPKGAPNVLIVLIDDAGFGVPDTFGGFAHTPTLSQLRDEGISYNRFHTTSICSPTRASLLTGRNHQRVGSGTIAERAVDWDGYTGVMPKTSATIAEVLKNYGYKTSAFGKWHNTPADQTTAMGPFTYWPTSYGFEHFYGFLAGETSQWEPRLVENTTAIEPPHDEKYHLTEDMADKGITWLKKHRAFSPDKPFFMYWAPGGVHGPHHVTAQWADKYKGKFDQGWDKLREEIFARQKALGWIPANTELTPRDTTMAAWADIPESERAFQTAPDGTLRRLRRTHRRAGRQAGGLPRPDRPARQHDHLLHLGRQRLLRRRAERLHQRTARAESNPQHHRPADQGARRTRRPQGARRSADRQHLSRRLGLGGQHAVPLHQARRRALRRHAQSARRFVAEEDQGRTRRRARSSTTSTTSPRRSTT